MELKCLSTQTLRYPHLWLVHAKPNLTFSPIFFFTVLRGKLFSLFYSFFRSFHLVMSGTSCFPLCLPSRELCFTPSCMRIKRTVAEVQSFPAHGKDHTCPLFLHSFKINKCFWKSTMCKNNSDRGYSRQRHLQWFTVNPCSIKFGKILQVFSLLFKFFQDFHNYPGSLQPSLVLYYETKCRAVCAWINAKLHFE